MIKASSRSKWRAWLVDNHASESEVWLVYYKKHTGKPSVTYMESVKEALCFGWIDGIKKSIDEETYMHRFTPRKPGSKWSPLNIRLAGELIEAGQMAQAGLKAFEQRTEYNPEQLKALRAKNIPLAPDMKKRLKANQKAWDYFNQLTPGYRKQYIGAPGSALRPAGTAHRSRQTRRGASAPASSPGPGGSPQ